MFMNCVADGFPGCASASFSLSFFRNNSALRCPSDIRWISIESFNPLLIPLRLNGMIPCVHDGKIVHLCENWIHRNSRRNLSTVVPIGGVGLSAGSRTPMSRFNV